MRKQRMTTFVFRFESHTDFVQIILNSMTRCISMISSQTTCRIVANEDGKESPFISFLSLM